MLEDPVDVYLSLWDKVKERSLRYYDMYPDDVAVVKTIVRKLMQAEEDGNLPRLPSGGKLSAVRFLQLGMSLGGGPTSFATMHDLLSSAFLQPLIAQKGAVDSEFTRGFLKAIDTMQPFDEHPIYFFMHESIYADQNRGGTVATNWSADRAYEIKKSGADGAEYDYAVTSREDSAHPVLFLGEMVFPWMGQSVYAETGGFGCSTLAEALAKKDDWGPLYDADTMRSALADGKTRAAAAVYYDDMYVDFGCCRRVLARGGPLEKCKAYVTNEYQHSGLRDDGATIFNKLHGMATGATRVPS